MDIKEEALKKHDLFWDGQEEGLRVVKPSLVSGLLPRAPLGPSLW